MPEHPICPTCKKPMEYNQDDINYSPSASTMDHPFAFEVKATLFQTFSCEDCGTSLRQAVQTAVYKNPEVKELAPTR